MPGAPFLQHLACSVKCMACTQSPGMVAGMQDTALDCPDAATCMALMMARMCVDRVLPSACLEQQLPSLTDGSLGVSVVHSAGGLVGAACGTVLPGCLPAGLLGSLQAVQVIPQPRSTFQKSNVPAHVQRLSWQPHKIVRRAPLDMSALASPATCHCRVTLLAMLYQNPTGARRCYPPRQACSSSNQWTVQARS